MRARNDALALIAFVAVAACGDLLSADGDDSDPTSTGTVDGGADGDAPKDASGEVVIPGPDGGGGPDGADGASLCGNGNTDDGEVCDDGNNVSGDGCKADCTALD